MEIVNFMNTLHETPTCTELVPYCEPKKIFKPNDQFRPGDALQAIKLDPAVLEARVTIKTGQKKHCGSVYDDQDLASNTVSDGSHNPSFEEMVKHQEASLLSLTPQQYHLLLNFVSTLRRQRKSNQINLECAFCKNNGESIAWYSSHALRNWRGRVQCPVLRAYHCPRCGATGDRAHTIKYCMD